MGIKQFVIDNLDVIALGLEQVERFDLAEKIRQLAQDEQTRCPLTYIDREEVDSYGGQDLDLEEVSEKMMKSEALMDSYWLAMEHAVETLTDVYEEIGKLAEAK